MATCTSVLDPPAAESIADEPGAASKDDLYAQLLNAESNNVGVHIEICNELPKAPGNLAAKEALAELSVPS